MTRRVAAFTALVITASLLSVLPVSPASADSGFMYWADADTNAIGRANLDGTGVNEAFITGGALVSPSSVAVTADHIYWTTDTGASDVIGRANLDGSGRIDSFITGVADSSGLVVTDTHIYWTSSGANAIGRANLDGTGADPAFITGAAGPSGVAVDGTHIYWSNTLGGGFIGRAKLDGTAVDQTFIPDATAPTGVAVFGGHIYWGELLANSIARANVDGTGIEPSFISGAFAPVGLAVDSTHVYWATSASSGVIGRANLDGSSPNPSLITLTGVAVGLAVPSFTVTFDANGGAGTMPPQVASAPATLRANAFTRTGFTFAGWNTAANGSGTAFADQATFPFAANTTLFAQWTPIPRTVTFDANGGSGTMAPQSAVTPTALAANAFTRTGFTFAGWNTAANGSGTVFADRAVFPFAADATLFAQWTAAPIPVPARVTSVTAKATKGKVVVRWVAPSGPLTGYVIQTARKKTFTKAGTAGPAATRFAWKKATKGVTYRVRVAAANVSGRGPFSRPVRVTAR